MPTPGTLLSALDIIKRSMKRLGVLAQGETPTANQGSDALAILNAMIDGWNADDLMIFTEAISTFTLVPGQQTYTLGVGGNFDPGYRPAKIDRMSILNINTTPQTLELPIELLDEAQWQQIVVKNVQTPLPFHCYDDGAYPLRNLNFWGIPNINNQIAIYAWQPLSQFPDLDTPLTFPPAYYKCIINNLAVELAPDYGKDPSPLVMSQAIESMAKVKAINEQIPDLRCDDGVTAVRRASTPYSWITGW